MLYKFKTLAQTLLTLKSNFWLENWILTFLGYGYIIAHFVLEELLSYIFFQSIAPTVFYKNPLVKTFLGNRSMSKIINFRKKPAILGIFIFSAGLARTGYYQK